jgi:LysM repeat protein
VESGDTLFGIALQYGTTVDDLRTLNAGSVDNDIISIGQELVVSTSAAAAAPTATPLPAPPTEAPTAASESGEGGAAEGGTGGESEAPAEPSGSSGTSICVLAYHDRNGDTFRDATVEELLPNAKFSLADASSVIAEYTSDGISEPYCFSGLTPGAYRVVQEAPPGYANSGPAEWPAALSESSSLELQFGNVRDESADTGMEPANPGEDAEEEGNEEGGSRVSRLLTTAAKVSGIIVLVLAAGIAVLFVLTRRRG